MNPKIKIAIADDHPLVIDGLHHILGKCADMEIVGSYHDGAQLLSGIAKKEPDVLLLDIQMPGQTGDEIADIIRVAYPKIRMLALTNLDNVYYIHSMLRSGVLGYILKTTTGNILPEAIRTVYRGEEYLEPVLKEKMAADARQMKNNPHSQLVLSRREKEVLQCIAANLTSQQIADKLFVSKRTIDSHRLNLMMKLDVKNVAALIKKAIQLGLV